MLRSLLAVAVVTLAAASCATAPPPADGEEWTRSRDATVTGGSVRGGGAGS